ncbi:MAG: hypothetical protein CMI17_07035 [Opitutaceae bacterium]|nr:hypothetical protein [Opitutaceae bacterium]
MKLKQTTLIEAIGSHADPRLKGETHEVAKRIRSTRLMRRQSRRWLLAFTIALALLVSAYLVSVLATLLIAGTLTIIVGTLLLNRSESNRTPLDYIAAAQAIESANPSLKQALSTAMEQGDYRRGPLNFLQEKLIDEILDHNTINSWQQVGKEDYKNSLFRNLAATLPIWALLIVALLVEPKQTELLRVVSSTASLTVSPGDTDAERGSTVVITARFEGESLPKDVELVTLFPDGNSTRNIMGQSLSDPVFVYSLRKVDSDLRYHVTFDGRESEAYKIEIFELPALIQADANLDFPDYTQIPDRFVEDTQRISAVVGTYLTYSFTTNKPIEVAKLVGRDGREVLLEAANPESTRFETSLIVEDSLRMALELSDEKGRKNPFPPDIRVEALPNKKPELSIAFPRGDQRVSPIEEIALEAEARDDFGLLDYGVAFSIGTEPPIYLSSAEKNTLDLDSDFETILSLEEQSVEADDLLTWWAWADDYGPDGESRRSTSDLYFAEVRSLDEIFRENESGGGQGQQQQGNQGEELIETQRQITIAIWKLKQRGLSDDSFIEDAKVINESQTEAVQELEALKERLDEEKAKTAAELAGSLMGNVLISLDTVIIDGVEDPLDKAASSAQGATQALLRIQPKEFNVSRSRQAGGGGGGQSRNQRQLDQLDFRQEENRYETASQAQSLTSPEQKEQLQVLSKLSQLARRQEDINKRLQELQTAIAQAKDEEERERIRRELKRLEEEQQQMLADVDETRQRMDRLQSNENNREARQQLDQAREEMREIGESLRNEEISQALATGTRAQENLEDLKEDFRNETSSQFTEQLREARKTARDLAENQRNISEALENLDQEGGPRLDNSEDREEITERIVQQQERLDSLMRDLREVTEASEFSEQKLHRELYDLLREQSQSEIDDQLQMSSEMLSQGFVEQTQGMQPELQLSFDELQQNVEQAASSILGDEATSLRFAQEELDSLSRDLQADNGEQEGARPGQEEDQRGYGLQNLDSNEENPGQKIADAGEPGSSQQRRPENKQPSQQPSDQPGQQLGSGQEPRQSLAQQPTESQRQQLEQSPGGEAGEQGQQPGQSGQSVAQQPNSNQPRQGQQPGSQGGGSPTGGRGGGDGGSDIASALDDFLSEFSRNPENESPLTGRGFNDWAERLRTVEELVDQPDIRQRLSQAREEAERVRAEFRRHGSEPKWGVVNDGIIAPLKDARTWVAQELARYEDPNALQPIDRDPVPRAYQESVRKYYESLGEK